MLKTIISFCLLAFSTAQATILAVGDTTKVGRDYTCILHAWKAATSNDTIWVYDSIQEADSLRHTSGGGNQLNILLHIADGVTVSLEDTLTSQAAVTSAFLYIRDNGFTLENNGTIQTHRMFFEFGADNITLSGGTLQGTRTGNYGTTGGLVYFRSGSDCDNVAISDMTFLGTDGLAIQPSGINFREVETATVTDCVFEDCYTAVYGSGASAGAGDWHGLTVTGCTFTDTQGSGVYVGSAICDTLNVSDCTFTGCGTAINVVDGVSNVTIGDGDGVDDIFIYNPQPYGMEVSGVSTVIQDTYISGSTASNFHGILMGRDSGSSLGDTTLAYSVTLDGVTFTLGETYSPDTLDNYHCIVMKDNNGIVRNCTFNIPASYADIGLTLATAVYAKGAKDPSIYNNTINDLSGLFTGLRLAAQDAEKVEGLTAYNNIYTGTAYVLAMYAGHEISAFDNSYLSSATGYDMTNTVDFSPPDSIWYGSANFTDESSWRMSFGGEAGLTGVTAMPSGFVAVGAIQRSTDPVISLNQNGFETPVEAFLRCRDMGLTGVSLDWYIHGSGAADALNMDNWLHGAGATGDGTASGSTWEVQAFDTLRVGRVR